VSNVHTQLGSTRFSKVQQGDPVEWTRLWLALYVAYFVSPHRSWDYLPGLLWFEYIYILYPTKYLPRYKGISPFICVDMMTQSRSQFEVYPQPRWCLFDTQTLLSRKSCDTAEGIHSEPKMSEGEKNKCSEIALPRKERLKARKCLSIRHLIRRRELAAPFNSPRKLL
jgi:hypothetical protein